jgi:uncharacterized phage protein (TIGR01671 family)
MREIKFRGKRIDNGEWVYGWYYHDQRFKNGHSCQDVYIIRDELDQDFEVDPATVGQDTGFKDRNGVEIFDGDIIWWGKDDHAPASNVFFDDGAFKATDPESDTWELLIDVLNGAKVIGNIHDSPDFLGVTE